MTSIVLYRKGKATAFVAEIDDRDVDRVSVHRWSVFEPRGSKTRYARSSIGGKTVYLHRLVLSAEKGDEIDHIDGEGLNNTRANLRFVTHAENLKAAAKLPGRYKNQTHEELDRELEEWMARNE